MIIRGFQLLVVYLTWSIVHPFNTLPTATLCTKSFTTSTSDSSDSSTQHNKCRFSYNLSRSNIVERNRHLRYPLHGPAFRRSSKLYVVDSPSLFAEAQEEENKKKKHHHRSNKLSSSSSSLSPNANPASNAFFSKAIQTIKDKAAAKTKDTPRLVNNIMDYKTVIVEEREQMVIVFFHADWCKSCRATKPLFLKLCREYSHLVKFTHVPLTKQTAYLQEGLGVPSVPFGHIYHPEVGLVEERKLSKSHFKEFQNLVQHYVQGYCDIPDDDHVNFGTNNVNHRDDDPEESVNERYDDFDGEYNDFDLGVFE